VLTALLSVLLVAVQGIAEGPPPVAAPGVLELKFTPVGNAQIAIWVERADGTFVATLRLTESVAKRGLGNRPGASQMNSGFRWPYGRREGALPIWATRRASAAGAKKFKQVIFMDRRTEGLASRAAKSNPSISVSDASPDEYYCLSFKQERSTKDALDAVSCASLFNSDKGRFLTEADEAAGYAEPYDVPGTNTTNMRPLPKESLYPPRQDVTLCGTGCGQHPDVAKFVEHVHEVMPEIDAVTMATPAGSVPQDILTSIPSEWSAGDYRACLEVNTEGDYNTTFDGRSYPTPVDPSKEWKEARGFPCGTPSNPATGTGFTECWDQWAMSFGYPYRGQPSVVYCAEFKLGGEAVQSFSTADPIGSAGSWDTANPSYGKMRAMDGMTDDPVSAPGSGADRLQLMEEGFRFKVVMRPPISCTKNEAPTAVTELSVTRHPEERNAHQWARLHFRAAADDTGIARYEVRASTQPIVDDASFMAAVPAKQATIAAAELLVPTTGAPGEMIEVDLGGLNASTHYYIAVRPMDGCTLTGGIESVEFTTPKRVFATVTPCFVATAAYGSPLAGEVGVLRRFRDRQLASNPLGRAIVSAYYAVGPALADLIRPHQDLRAAARLVLGPAIAIARWLDD
jgi:hypothetical protein